jgi:hypothetical protein
LELANEKLAGVRITLNRRFVAKINSSKKHKNPKNSKKFQVKKFKKSEFRLHPFSLQIQYSSSKHGHAKKT